MKNVSTDCNLLSFLSSSNKYRTRSILRFYFGSNYGLLQCSFVDKSALQTEEKLQGDGRIISNSTIEIFKRSVTSPAKMCKILMICFSFIRKKVI